MTGFREAPAATLVAGFPATDGSYYLSQPDFNKLAGAVFQRESHMTPGAVGPQTKYGRAIGLSQMLPGTAHEMATKLGVPWRPDLLAGRTDEAAQYQARLGAAYLQQGLTETGNVRDALRYYHGGPNRNLWGPKTNAYADGILSSLGG